MLHLRSSKELQELHVLVDGLGCPEFPLFQIDAEYIALVARLAPPCVFSFVLTSITLCLLYLAPRRSALRLG